MRPSRAASCDRRLATARDARHGPQLERDGRDEGNRIGAGREGVAQGDERLAVATGDRGVGDREGGYLDPAAVVALDDLLGHVSGNVGDQLLTRRRELGQVVGERRHERTERRRGDALLGGLEVSPAAKSYRSESRLMAGHGDLDAAALARPDGVEQLLAANGRARVAEHDRRALLREGEVRDGLGQEGVRALLDARDAHEARLAEQRRRRDGEQRALCVVVGLEDR